MIMTAKEILKELETLGSESYKKVIFNHGVKEPCFGVKIGDLKKIQKRIKKDHALALELFDTGNYDAMYLAGLVADDAKMTKKDLQHWIKKMHCAPLASSTVPWVAVGSPHGWDLGLEWIESKNGLVAGAGWVTLAGLVSVKPDEDLDLRTIKRLLQRIKKEIHKAPNEVRYQMNAFVICVGSYVKSLTPLAMEIGEKVGKVDVDMGNTACQVPFAPDYIRKVEKRNPTGKKKKTVKC